MRKALITSLLAILCTSSAWAIPAKPRIIRHTQSDGTELTLRLVGDEHMHYYFNETDGSRMMKTVEGDFQVIEEAQFNDMKLKAAARKNVSNERRAAAMNLQKGAFGEPNVITGQKKGIVILVNFTDKAMKSGHDQACFNNIFNQQGYNQDNHIGCVADFFNQQSYGQLSIDFDVVGPVTVSHNMAYYGGNDWSGNDQHPADMAKEACTLVDSQVNFADYDWDGDGYVDQVFVVYAGYAESAGASDDTIWPHEWDFTSAGIGEQTYDGVKVNTYACSSELDGTSGSTLDGIGTACHEFSHCLGYPDSYDTDYSGGIGMEAFDIMDMGSYNGPNYRGEVPCGYSAYERWMAGWITLTELNDPASIVDMEAINDEGEAYIIRNGGNSNEYFILENRQSRGWFQYFLNNQMGHGLFITHVDYNYSVWSQNKPNDDKNHQRYTWVAADKKYGTYSSYYGSWDISESEEKGDFFPGTSNVTSFKASDYSSYGGKWFTKDTNGTYFTSHELTNISESNGKISFDFDGGDTGERFTVTFNAGNGSCDTQTWTQTKSSSEGVTLPSATIASEEWAFAGWCGDSIAEVTYNKPSLKEAGKKFVPTQDTILYAVYAYSLDGTPATTPSAWCSAPALVEVTTPTLAFANPADTTIFLGDSYSNAATCEGSTSTITYSSSAPVYATVDEVGNVTSVKVGTTTITAKVAGVMGVSKAASASYKVKVQMATLTDLVVKTPPSKVRYTEKENFNPAGLVLTATYANQYSQDITSGYTYTPNGPLQLTDEKVTISYTEGGVTLSQDIAISVEALPRYSVTFVAGSGSCSVTELKQSEYQEELIMPEATISSERWEFYGWYSYQIEDSTDIRPNVLKAGTKLIPDNDYTLYAVYRRAEGEEGEKWIRVEMTDEITEGIFALITPDGHAFNGEIEKGHGQTTAEAFDFDVNGDATEAPEGTCEITFQTKGQGFSMYNEELGYLYAKDKKSGNLAWHEGEGSYWRVKNDNWVYVSCSAYLRTYQNSSFRTYGSKTNGTLSFAQKVNGANYVYAHTPATENSDPGNALQSLETAPATTGIYTIDGRKAGNELESLPTGIYVIGGKKVTIK